MLEREQSSRYPATVSSEHTEEGQKDWGSVRGYCQSKRWALSSTKVDSMQWQRMLAQLSGGELPTPGGLVLDAIEGWRPNTQLMTLPFGANVVGMTVTENGQLYRLMVTSRHSCEPPKS